MNHTNLDKNDLFADIASKRVEMRGNTLEIPHPRTLNKKYIDLRSGKGKLFEPQKK